MIVCLYMFVLSGLLIQHLGFGATAVKLRHVKETLAFSMGVGLRPYGSPTNASPAKRHSNSISRSGPQILIDLDGVCHKQVGCIGMLGTHTENTWIFSPNTEGGSSKLSLEPIGCTRITVETKDGHHTRIIMGRKPRMHGNHHIIIIISAT